MSADTFSFAFARFTADDVVAHVPTVRAWIDRILPQPEYTARVPPYDLAAAHACVDWLRARGADPARVEAAADLLSPAGIARQFRALGLGGAEAWWARERDALDTALPVVSRTDRARYLVCRRAVTALFPQEVARRLGFGEYVRRRMREEGFTRRLLPPEPIPDDYGYPGPDPADAPDPVRDG